MSEVDDTLRRLRARINRAIIKAADKVMAEGGFLKGPEVFDIPNGVATIPYVKQEFRPVDHIEITFIVEPPEKKTEE